MRFNFLASTLFAMSASAALTILGPAPHMDLSPTTTLYNHTVTKTVLHPCGTETAVFVKHMIMGHGPVRFITATATADATTVTAHACHPTKLTLLKGPTAHLQAAATATPSSSSSSSCSSTDSNAHCAPAPSTLPVYKGFPLYGACCARRRGSWQRKHCACMD